MKIKLLTASLLATTLTSLAQPLLCDTVDWQTGPGTNNLRLAISNYNDHTTFPLPCGPYFFCDNGKGLRWNGSFTEISTNDPTTIYYRAYAASISGRRLQEAVIYYNTNSARWWLDVTISGNFYGYGSQPLPLWKGYLDGYSPVGVYTRTEWPTWVGSSPSTVTVACYPADEDKIYAIIEVRTSTFHGYPNAPESGRSDTCTARSEYKHLGPDGKHVNELQALDAPAKTIVRDGDTLSIEWPDCCNSSWGIAGEGALLVQKAGYEPIPVNIVTLCFPDFRGNIPIDVLTPTNGTSYGKGYLLKRPYTAPAIPPLPEESHYYGVNGMTWKVHMKYTPNPYTGGDVYCFFEVLDMKICANAAWSTQAGADWDGAIFDVFTTEGKILRDSMTWVSTATNGYQYIWYSGPQP